jgi:hypothetical protein
MTIEQLLNNLHSLAQTQAVTQQKTLPKLKK